MLDELYMRDLANAMRMPDEVVPAGKVTVSGPQVETAPKQPEMGTITGIPQTAFEKALETSGVKLSELGDMIDQSAPGTLNTLLGREVPIIGNLKLRDFLPFVGSKDDGKLTGTPAALIAAGTGQPLRGQPVVGSAIGPDGQRYFGTSGSPAMLNEDVGTAVVDVATLGLGRPLAVGAKKAIQATKDLPIGMSIKDVSESMKAANAWANPKAFLAQIEDAGQKENMTRIDKNMRQYAEQGMPLSKIKKELERDIGLKLSPEQVDYVSGFVKSKGKAAAPAARSDVVSTRLPTAVKATEDPLASNLIIDFDAVKKDPEAFKHNMNLVQQYPNFASKSRTPEKRAEDFIAEVKDNLLYLYDKVPEQTRQRSKLWYDGARNIVDNWTGQFNANDNAISGILAVLSPQKDWFMNVSLGERVLDTMSNKQSFKWDSTMDEMAKVIWSKPQYAPMVDAIRGKSLAELPDTGLKAMWLRTYDQAYNPREHQIVNPEGTFAGVRLTDKGVPYKTGWGSLNEIGKAVSIYENPTLANISNNLGQQHKVRNFYNNIYDPTNPAGYVTIDTHAVAAGLLRPLSGASTEVAHNFGSNVLGAVGPKNSSVTGVQGTYGLYAEAYRRAAQERGVLPREMQSITWEAVRGLFPDTFKNAKNSELIDSIWLKYRKGQISQTEARDEVFRAANGINPPEWEGAGLRPGSVKAISNTPNQGELPGAGVPGGAAGNMGSRKRNTAPKGNSNSVTGQPSGMAIGE